MQFKSQLGILGGGQLSMMLIQRAQAMGLYPSVLASTPQDPACHVCPQAVLGNPKNADDLKRFVMNLDYLTFESEFFDAGYLKTQLKDFKGTIFPSLDVLQLLQDRKTQKESFIKSKLKTSVYLITQDEKILGKFFKAQGALVAKTRWNGYDGYGTFVLKTKTELDKFLLKTSEPLDHFIFEKFIPFQYEVALQASRSRAGHTIFFPLVKTIQKDNKCFLVEGPEKTPPSLQRAIQKYLDRIGYVGTIGFEFFKTKTGLILNEVAPRVHNTGHHTLDSCNVDQFSMHLLCALQDKLPKVELKSKSFVMLNLIGKSEADVKMPDRMGGNLFWYGKKNRKGRKLGHINYVGENKKALVTRALNELLTWKL